MWFAGDLLVVDDDRDAEAPQSHMNAALAAFGLSMDGASTEPDYFYLWPDCVHSWNFWMLVQTQWVRNKAGQPERLDYTGVQVCMQMYQIPSNEQQQLFSDIQTMERAVLIEVHSNNK